MYFGLLRLQMGYINITLTFINTIPVIHDKNYSVFSFSILSFAPVFFLSKYSSSSSSNFIDTYLQGWSSIQIIQTTKQFEHYQRAVLTLIWYMSTRNYIYQIEILTRINLLTPQARSCQSLIFPGLTNRINALSLFSNSGLNIEMIKHCIYDKR